MTKKIENVNGEVCFSLSSILWKFNGDSMLKLVYVREIFDNGQVCLDNEWVQAMVPIYRDGGLEKSEMEEFSNISNYITDELDKL